MAALGDFFARFFGSKNKPTPGLNPDELEADWLVVGLGNPGAKYAATRHNVGYMAIDDLLAADGDVLEPVRGMDVQVAPLSWAGQKVLAVRSGTFMNLSGDPVAPLAQQLGIAPDHIIVLHDELDLPANRIRIKQSGNENGHNGLKSLTERLGTRNYLRVRIGIARPPKGSSIPDYVLGPVDAGAGFDDAIATAAEAARLIVTDGLGKAQNQIHSR
ncbi:aminoacyl-tRNA hydrolase [Corynebacterium tuberculostearicum]|uniref:aminoacyl-tRNA hydrolase n=1 Tax=Corynebacterium tuberculostearicum TaxID=38304 RepID=UPI002654853F|nr:aminoacyl-tRNA hydrolase [Corynebacterium tuberculostearicum]MDN8596705.1 aminoacyl-tRNA hydrolase [Corynebacterium tuberculostearicum]